METQSYQKPARYKLVGFRTIIYMSSITYIWLDTQTNKYYLSHISPIIIIPSNTRMYMLLDNDPPEPIKLKYRSELKQKEEISYSDIINNKSEITKYHLYE